MQTIFDFAPKKKHGIRRLRQDRQHSGHVPGRLKVSDICGPKHLSKPSYLVVRGDVAPCSAWICTSCVEKETLKLCITTACAFHEGHSQGTGSGSANITNRRNLGPRHEPSLSPSFITPASPSIFNPHHGPRFTSAQSLSAPLCLYHGP